MSTSSSPTTNDDRFVCECKKEWMRSACREGFYQELKGKRYCIMHYPSTEKKDDFGKALQRKLDDKDFDFGGVWFPGVVSFQRFTFSSDAFFNGAWFSDDADFGGAQFSADAWFQWAKFKAEVNFQEASFSADAYFMFAEFSAHAYFSSAQFGAYADFNSVRFRGNAIFTETRFSAVADFKGEFSAYANFAGAKFSADALFSDVPFGEDAVFGSAQFGGDADFSSAKIRGDAIFNYAQFSACADFGKVAFSKNVQFSGVVFNSTVNFQGTTFVEIDGSTHKNATSDNGPNAAGDAVKTRTQKRPSKRSRANRARTKPITVSFAGATFKDIVRFDKSIKSRDRVFMSFEAAIFDKPERAIFHTTHLRPHWFINVDSRKFTFVDVTWDTLDRRDAIRKEVAALENSGKSDLKHLLQISFQQLAVNAEDNNRYEEAANFRYMAMEVRRLQRGRKVDPLRLSWWYWLLSGYGERVPRAFGALLSILLLFAAIYWVGGAAWWQPKQTSMITSKEFRDQNEPTVAKPLSFSEALVYSAAVMALQKPEPLPVNKRAKAFVLFETVLGPFQAALLALAIRRKFMR